MTIISDCRITMFKLESFNFTGMHIFVNKHVIMLEI